jgi:hypothetical protein
MELGCIGLYGMGLLEIRIYRDWMGTGTNEGHAYSSCAFPDCCLMLCECDCFRRDLFDL